LSRAERCLYAGVKLQQKQARGALILLTEHDAHLKGGTFNATEMSDLLKTAVQKRSALGLCQDHRKKLPAAVLDHCMATHRYVRGRWTDPRRESVLRVA